MSEYSDAFTDLQAEFVSVLGGGPQKIKIGGVEYDAIVEDATFDAVVAAGGEGDSGGFVAQVAIALLPNRPTEQTQVEARGQVRDLLSIANVNGVTWILTCGSIAIEG